jgi:hypothetical protein
MKIDISTYEDKFVATLNSNHRHLDIGQTPVEAIGALVQSRATEMGILIKQPDGTSIGSENETPSYSDLLEQNRRMSEALGNLEKELPIAISYAESHGLKPDFGGSAVHIVLWRCQGVVNDGLGKPPLKG